jgi:D-alanyl-D-alanine carboxypeptidase
MKIISVYLLILSSLLSGFTAVPAKYTGLKKAVNQAMNHPNLKYGHWSMYAVNAKTGQVLVDVNSHTGMAPASNLKLLT